LVIFEPVSFDFFTIVSRKSSVESQNRTGFP